MRPEGSSLDLNNLPDDYYINSRDIENSQVVDLVLLDDTSTSGRGRGGGAGGVGGGGSSGSSGGSSSIRRKKSGGKDESGKVYECRFCSLKFCKSQALGGHMNRHRQERETEVLNRARQLVYSTEAAYGPPPPPYMPPPAAGGYTHHQHQGGYPSRIFTGSSSLSILPSRPVPPPPLPLHQPPYNLYTSPVAPARLGNPYPPRPHPPNHDYFVGHAVPTSSAAHFGQQQPPPLDNMGYRGGGGSNYTCIGAPVRFMPNSNSGSGRGPVDGGGNRSRVDEGSLDQDVGVNCAIPRSGGGGGGYVGTLGQRQRVDSSSSINRYHDHHHHRHHGSF